MSWEATGAVCVIVGALAVVEQADTTVVVFPGQKLAVNKFGDFELEL